MKNSMESLMKKKIYGCLAGGLIGDAMGAPVENWHYSKIAEKYGTLDDFEGAGTDDSAVKLILCDALINNGGHVTADEFAVSFLKFKEQYYELFYIPVRNMVHKLEDDLVLPVYAGVGNMQSSSSAMAISPMGIVNACDPRRAAIETYDVAGMVHAGDTTFCRDAACSMAAAVAEAMKSDATIDSILAASTAFLHKKSSKLMLDLINEALQKARELGTYEKYREWVYANRTCNVICDSRETVPATLALFYLAKGDPVQSIIYGANFGRDADTIASMIGAIAGAYKGIDAFRPEWVEKVEQNNNQESLINDLYNLVSDRMDEGRKILAQCEVLIK